MFNNLSFRVVEMRMLYGFAYPLTALQERQDVYPMAETAI
jgi:hypothetical protein